MRSLLVVGLSVGQAASTVPGVATASDPYAAAVQVAAASGPGRGTPPGLAFGAIQGDPGSRVSSQLRREICSRVRCVKSSLVMTRGRVDVTKMQARNVSGYLSGSVKGRGAARNLSLALVTTSERPARTWRLPLTSKGRLPTESLEATSAELVNLLVPLPEASATAVAPPAVSGPAAEPSAADAPLPTPSPAPMVTSAQPPEPPPPPPVEAPTPPPVPAPQPAAAGPVEGAARAKREGRRTEGLIPGILIGPKFSATALFPPNLMVGGELKVLGYLGASFEYGIWPRSDDVKDYSLSARTWSTGLRAYPFGGAFFVGAVLGHYELTGTQVSSNARATAKSTYLGPQIGWKWDFDVGLFLGLNLGYAFSLDYASSLSGVATSSSLQDAKNKADSYIKTGVPIWTALELGWFF
jgi:hypothetical protein